VAALHLLSPRFIRSAFARLTKADLHARWADCGAFRAERDLRL